MTEEETWDDKYQTILLLGKVAKIQKYSLESRWDASRFPFKAKVYFSHENTLTLKVPRTIYWELYFEVSGPGSISVRVAEGKGVDPQHAAKLVDNVAIGLVHEMRWYSEQPEWVT